MHWRSVLEIRLGYSGFLRHTSLAALDPGQLALDLDGQSKAEKGPNEDHQCKCGDVGQGMGDYDRPYGVAVLRTGSNSLANPTFLQKIVLKSNRRPPSCSRKRARKRISIFVFY